MNLLSSTSRLLTKTRQSLCQFCQRLKSPSLSRIIVHNLMHLRPESSLWKTKKTVLMLLSTKSRSSMRRWTSAILQANITRSLTTVTVRRYCNKSSQELISLLKPLTRKHVKLKLKQKRWEKFHLDWTFAIRVMIRAKKSLSKSWVSSTISMVFIVSLVKVLDFTPNLTMYWLVSTTQLMVTYLRGNWRLRSCRQV